MKIRQNLKMKHAILTLLVLGSFLCSAQQKALDIYFSQLRQGKSPSIPQEVYKAENVKSTLTALNAFSKDTLIIVRSKAALITRAVGTKSAVNAIRQQSVTLLINAANDKSTGNAGAALN